MINENDSWNKFQKSVDYWIYYYCYSSNNLKWMKKTIKKLIIIICLLYPKHSNKISWGEGHGKCLINFQVASFLSLVHYNVLLCCCFFFLLCFWVTHFLLEWNLNSPSHNLLYLFRHFSYTPSIDKKPRRILKNLCESFKPLFHSESLFS